MPTLLDLPAVVMDRIAQGLTSKETLRLHLLVCKSLSVGGVFEGGFWSRALMARLRKFRPASLYYDGPANGTNDELDELTGRDRFPEQAALCDGRLAAALQAGGVNGVTWTGERLNLSFHTAAHVVLPPDVAQVMANRSIIQYAHFVRAFECWHCRADAQRQCAGCGILLCVACCVRCSEDRPRPDTQGPYTDGPLNGPRVYKVTLPTFCPFVLCSICTRCPPNELLCPAHIDCSIGECSRCDERACDDHRYNNPCSILSCSTCNWTLCLCDSCRRPEKRLLQCLDWDTDEGCMGTYCSDCCPSEVCPFCGRHGMNE